MGSAQKNHKKYAVVDLQCKLLSTTNFVRIQISKKFCLFEICPSQIRSRMAGNQKTTLKKNFNANFAVEKYTTNSKIFLLCSGFEGKIIVSKISWWDLKTKQN